MGRVLQLWAKRRVYTGFRNLEENIDKAHFQETGESQDMRDRAAEGTAGGDPRLMKIDQDPKCVCNNRETR